MIHSKNSSIRKFIPTLMIVLPLLAIVSFSAANGGLYAQFASAGYGGTATIEPMTATVSPGQHLDFTGHLWPHESNITITMGGMTVGSAHADGGGNFTTGSVTLPTTPGTYTYTFTATDGTMVTATITVTGNGSGGNGGGGTGTSTNNGSETLVPQQAEVMSGQAIDFKGTNFPHETDITITRDGLVKAHAHADGGGNFTTGALTMPTEPGTYTYVFTPVSGGTPISATITVRNFQ